MAADRVMQIPDAVLEVLLCPVCGGGVNRDDRSLQCVAGHAFDVARQGYVNLRIGSGAAGSADTADMVAARAEFLSQGHYAPIADEVAQEVGAGLSSWPASAPPRGQDAGSRNVEGSGGETTRDQAGSGTLGVIVDVGAGTGYYLANVLDALPGTFGAALDVSAYALRRAARAHPRAAAVGADAWRHMPLRDGSVSALLDIFAPRNVDEFHRVLRPDGVLIVVTPTTDHLGELVAALEMLSVDERKDERVEEAMSGHFAPESRQDVRFTVRLEAGDVHRLVRMGPSAHHVDDAAVQDRVTTLVPPGERIDVTASVVVSRYRKVTGSPAHAAERAAGTPRG